MNEISTLRYRKNNLFTPYDQIKASSPYRAATTCFIEMGPVDFSTPVQPLEKNIPDVSPYGTSVFISTSPVSRNPERSDDFLFAITQQISMNTITTTFMNQLNPSTTVTQPKRNSSKKIILALSLMVAGLFFGNSAWSQTTRTWQPAAGGDWQLAGNWSPGGQPAAGDNVIINSDQSAQITNMPGISLNNLTINGSCSIVSSASPQTLTVTGSFSVAAGKSLTLGNGNRVNFTLASTGTGTITGTVDIVSGGTNRVFTNNGDLTITGTGLITDATSTGANVSDFILGATATLRIGSTAGITTSPTATGNIQVGGARTLPVTANYIYNGTANQNTGTGLPTNLTGILTINNPGNTVTLSNAETIATGGTINIVAGTFAAATNLTMATTSAITRSGGAMTGTPQGAGVYNVTYTGNSMTTTTELTGSGLNNVTVNLTAGQTLTLDANRTPDGSLSVTSGIFDLSTFTINRSASAAGPLAISNGAVLRIGGTNPAPTNYTTRTFGASSTVEYYGGNQNIGTETFGHLIVSAGTKSTTGVVGVAGNFTLSAGTVNTGNSWNASGNWTVDGTFNQTAGTTTFSAGTTHGISGTGSSQFLTLVTSSSTINANSHDIRIAGDWTHGTSGIFNKQTSTVTFNGTVNQVQPTTAFVPDFYNLTISKSAGTLSSRVWTVTNNFELVNGTFSPVTLSSFNNVKLTAGTFTAPASITISGNWTNNGGTFTPGTGTVVFNNTTADQAINGTAPAQTFNNITAAKNANKLTIGGSTATVTVSSTLTMTSGNIDCGTTTFELGTSAASPGTLTYTAGTVIGKFKRWVSAGAASVSLKFPIGTASAGRNINVDFAAVNRTAGGSLTTEFKGSNPGSTGLPQTVGGISVVQVSPTGYWSVINAGIAGGNYTATVDASSFTFIDGTTTINDLPNTRLIKRSSTGGSNWESSATTGGTHNAPAGLNSVSASGLTTFSEFAIGLACVDITTQPLVSQSVCLNATPTAISVTPSNTSGTTYLWFSNAANSSSGGTTTGITTQTFTPPVTIAGTTYYYCVVTRSCGSVTTNTSEVIVNALPTVSITGSSSVCINGTTALSPATGGTWISNNPAVASVSNAGVVTALSAGSATFTFTSSTAPNCSAATLAVTVNALPVVTFTGTLTAQCVNSAIYILTGGAPAGGTYSGAGVTGNNFDASIAGAGTHTITYSYTDGNGCTNTATNTIVVNALPVVTFTGTLTAQCVNSTVYVVTGGAPAGGTYSGAGVTGNNFDASIAGAGTHTITYSYTDGNGCTNTATNTIVVNALPVVTFTGTLTAQCVNSTVYVVTGGAPAGGTYSGAGVTGNNFDASSAGAGTHTITYTYTDGNGCTNTATNTILVNILPAATISYPGSPYCATGTAMVDQVGQGGGTYSALPAGLSINSTTGDIDLATSTLGTYTVTYTFTDVNGCSNTTTTAVTVDALAIPVVTIAASPSGSICPGTSVTFTATASNLGGGTVTNYDFKVNGITMQSDVTDIYTTVDLLNGDLVTCDITIAGGTCLASAVAASNTITTAYTTYNITATAGANGSISPAGSVSVNCGSDQEFIITPDACYQIADVIVDGISVGAVNSYMFTGVQEDHTISVTFTDVYTVTAIVGPGGSLNPSGVTILACGGSVTYTFPADPCYELFDVLVDGVSVLDRGIITSYTFNNVTFNHVIEAYFSITTHTITASAGPNGTISQAGDTNVDCGTNLTYTITPEACYHVADVLVDGVSVGAITSYTFSNITASHTIHAIFALNTYNITATAGANGSINPAGNVSVSCGDDQTFIIAANACYYISDVLVDGASVGAVSSYTFTTVTSDHTIEAVFAMYTPPTCSIAGPDGPLCPSLPGNIYTAPGSMTSYSWSITGNGTIIGSTTGQTVIVDAGSANNLTYTLTLTITDGNGCQSTCIKTVSILDNTPPAITCPVPNASYVADADECNATLSFAATATDNCGAASIVYTVGGFPITFPYDFPVGNTVVTATATDVNGLNSTCNFTVVVLDNQAPSIICPSPIVVNNNTGFCSAIVNYTMPVGTDNCPGSVTVQIAGLPAGSAFPVGVTINTYRVTDASGNTASCSFTVTVNDTENPVITCPANITVNNDANACGAAVTFTATATDNCAGTVITYSHAPGSVFPIGTTTVTATATDASGNISTCTFTVTVNDTENPVITCPANITVNNDANACGAAVTFAATATDNCAGTVITYSQNPGTVFPIGTTTVTATATDASGNISTCTFTVTVNDTENPVITCPANITVNNDANACGAAVTFAATATDNCVGTVITYSQNPGTVFPIGTTTVTATATDASGNISTCTFTVTVNDTENPVITCPANITVNNDASTCGAAVTFTATATDNCAGTVITYSQNPGTVFPIGTTTVTATATDASGNISTCTFTVTVNDTENPVITCPANITVNNDANACGAAVTFAATATDNCVGTVITYSQNPGTVFPIGTTTVTATATDASGNISTCTFTVTVNDTENPVITCPANITVNNDANACGAAVTFAATATDNCVGTVITYSQNPGTVFPIGTTTVTATATDASGNISTCTFTVTVNDTENPVITCPANITVNNDANACGAAVTFTATATDNCAGTVITYSQNPGTVFPIGTTTVTATATDASGNISTCTFTVTVNDTENPVITCPANITVNNDASTCGAAVTFTATATDNCAGTVITYSQNPGTVFPIGTTMVTATATDVSGNISTCTFTVTVNDTENPVITCPANITVNNDANACGAAVTFTATATDNCAGTVITYSHAPGSVFPIGTTTVTATATDASGNISTCTFTVTVNDTENPVITCPANITVNNDASTCGAAVTFTATATDNCVGTVITYSHAPGSVFPIGTTTVTATATDASGNISTCTFTVTVNDTENPVITCPANITVNNDANACGAAVTFAATATDNCVGTVITYSQNPGTVFPIGTTTVTATATDASGNISTCTFTVTVNDTENPVITCPANITVNNDANACGAAVTFAATATDNCAGTVITYSHAPGSVFPIGTTTVTATATDASGNISTCTFTVTVNDTENPVITCPANITVNNDANTCGAAVTFAATATDNCVGTVITYSHAPGSVFPIGTTTVTATATDASGNISTCTFTVTVNDTENPVITCPANITVNNDASTCGAAVIFTATATDNCAGTVITYSHAPGSVFPIGTTTVTATATDASGNISTCTFTVTVNDTENPVITCPANITVNNDANACGAAVTFTATATDNCAGTVITYSQNPGTVFPIGTTTVTATATDVSGNISTCTFTVTVNDTENPVITCPANITVNNDANACGAAVTFTATATDNCAGTVITYSQNPGTVFPIGTTTVTATATDASGNISTCTFTVTVNDTENPVITCPANITVNNDANTCGAAVTFAATATDNCVGTVITYSHAPGSVFPIGTTTVTATATDASGNISTCTFTVTVNDTENPVITCPANITVNNDASTCGAAVIFTATATDNCAGTVITYSHAPGSVFPIGTTTVTATATDASGNISTCTFTVTVNDTENPVITCPANITVNNDANACGAAVTFTATATDNCAGTVITYSHAPGSVFPIGTTTVTATATDVSGNISTCTFTVTVNDTENPVITCPANITVNNDANACGAAVTFTATATDNCVGTVITYSQNPGTVFPIGTTTVTATATDASGNISTCTFTVTVNDTENPVITCPANITVNNDANACGAAVTFTATATDNCAGTVITYSHAPGSVFPIGTTTVTATATDASGNISTCTFTVTVNDTENPVITCPANITVNNDASTCGAAVTFTATATDNCAGTVITYSHAPGSVFPIGTTTVTATATDASGNISTCTFTVTVNDTENPVITCPANITVNNDANACGAAVTFTATATDNCAGTVITYSQNPGTVFPIGTTTVTATATDASGNISTCTFTVTVNDTENPVITCPANITVNNDANACGAAVTFTATATDNCVGTVITYSQNPGSVFPIGTTTVTATATDASGNISTCTFTVTVNDTENPVITCPANITVNNDANACGAAVTFAATATDNCVGTVITYSHAPGSVFPIGTTTVTATATDASGNISTCTFTVTVNDTENPVITCPANITVNNDASTCGAAVTFAATATDNCVGTVITYSQNPGTVFPIGTTTVTATATDASGNISTCTFTVTVNDTENPVITCPANITVNNDANACGAAVTFAATATDNCAGTVITYSHAPGSVFPIGTTTVTATATDASGNISTCTFTVTVNDTENPVITCPANITVNNDASTCGAAVTFTATATDNCVGTVITYSQNPGTVFPIGTTTVTATATDASGNISTCTFTVTVNDTENPVITCPANITVNNDASTCGAAVTFTATATDNCAGTVITYSQNPGTVFPIGTTTVTATATDASGNISTCTFTVTVNDTENPVITCPAPVTISTSACYITVALGTPIYSDNCPGALITNNAPLQFPVGTTTVTWTVTDASGNTATCTQLVTVTSTSGNIYVNDNTTAGDIYTTAAGSDLTGNGTSCAPYATIAHAISMANPGNTIRVDAGTYAENVLVDKSLTILGTNAGINPNTGIRVAETIVIPGTAAISSGEIFHIAASTSNVTIDGFTIDGDNPSLTSGYTSTNGADIDAAEGVTVYESNINNLTVTNNIIRNLSYFAVTLYDYPAGVASSGHVISNNKIQDMGTYDAGSGINLFGGGVLLYNNQYAAITNNVISNVRIGVQTGNFSQANPGTAASQVISGNTISARRRGIFHNLFYGSASPITISNNAITGVVNVNETIWDGILLASMQTTASITTGNNVDGSAITVPKTGISVWNCQTAPLISGGTISGVNLGININNYEGYPSTGSNAGNTSATIDGVTINGVVTAGIKVNDNPLNSNGATVTAEIINTTVSGATTATGILVTGSDASANIHDNASTVTGTAVGIDVTGSATATVYRNSIVNNGIGIRAISGGKLTSVSENFITGNTTDGILIAADAGTIGVINTNNLAGNGGFAINNLSPATLSAACNWFGSAALATVVTKINGSVTHLPYLTTGTDEQAGTNGFQNSTCKTLTEADPALVSIEMTDLSNTPVNANLLPLNSINRIQLPVLNLSQSTAVPSGTTKIRIDLGDKLILDPSFNLSTAPLNTYFTWTKVVEAGHDVIYGDQVADLDPSFVEMATFDVKAVVPGISLITADFQVTNHNNPTYFLTDEITTNNSVNLNYTVLNALTITFDSKLDVTCYGGNNGSITVHANGGATPYQFSIDGGTTWLPVAGTNTPYTFTGLIAGTYTIMAKDFLGQTVTLVPDVTISEPSVITLSASTIVSNVTCNGTATGTIDLTAIAGGGTPGYTYTYIWTGSNGGIVPPAQINNEDLTGVTAGDYSVSVTVTDNAGCVKAFPAAATATVTQPAILAATASGTNVTCFGGNNGTASVSVTGGTSPYSYLWSNGAVTQSISGLTAGTYSITVADANGCTTSSTYTVIESTIITLTTSTTITNVTCNGTATGAINLTATAGGGTPGYTYTYAWTASNGGIVPPAQINNEDLSGLTAGDYTVTVTVTDNAGCSKVFTAAITATVTEPSVLIAVAGGSDISCFGGNNGTATVTPGGGTAPYTYLWSNGAITQSISGLTAGTYSVIITDAHSCTAFASYTVTEPALLVAVASGTNVTCFGSSNGTAIVNVTGGTASYSYAWTGPGAFTAATQSISGLVPGTYTVLVTDGHGCTATSNYTVTEPSQITSLSGPFFVVTNVSCNGSNNGAINLTFTAQGGSGAFSYAYAWTGPGVFTATTEDISSLAPGTYNVIITVTDANGCTASFNGNATITEPPVLNAAVTAITQITCAGSSTGSVTVTATGGTPGYEYKLDAGAFQPTGTFTGLAAGVHTITAKDANGCLKAVTFTITEPANTDISLGADFSGNIFLANGDEITVVYNIAELAGKAGTPATLRIFKPAGYNIIFDNSQTSISIFANTYTLDNGKWALTTSNALYYEFSRTGPGGNNTIGCKEKVNVSFKLKRATSNISIFNLNAQFRAASGELILNNNSNSIILVGE